jgi:glycosyltransferase involved in cell wall biosynthesis
VFFKDQALAVSEQVDKVGVVAPVVISLKEVVKTKRFSFRQEVMANDNVTEYVQPLLSIPFLRDFNSSRQFHLGKRLFKKYIAEHGLPDVVHLQSSLLGELALWLKKEYNIPFVVTEHWSGFIREIYTKRESQIAAKVFAESKRNMAVSQSFVHALTSLFQQEFKVMPNIVNTDYFVPGNSKNEVFTFLHVAHLNANKNQEMLIRTFARFIKKGQHARLNILGGGDLYDSLQKLIVELGMQEHIKLFGKASREQVLLHMQQSHCFVLSSFAETFGVVLIEAMACGLPVLASRCGGPEQIVTPETGFLFDINEKDMLAKMEQVIHKEFDAEKIRQHVVNTYSPSVVAKQIVDAMNS